MLKRLGTKTVGGVATASLMCGVGGGAANAASDSSAPTRSAVVATDVKSVANTLTEAQWRAMAADARRSGDMTTARQAEAYANGKIPVKRVWFAVAKKAVVYMLRHGASKLPGPLKKYAGQAAKVLEDMDEWKESAMVLGLSRAGVPPDIALDLAKVINGLLPV